MYKYSVKLLFHQHFPLCSINNKHYKFVVVQARDWNKNIQIIRSFCLQRQVYTNHLRHAMQNSAIDLIFGYTHTIIFSQKASFSNYQQQLLHSKFHHKLSQTSSLTYILFQGQLNRMIKREKIQTSIFVKNPPPRPPFLSHKKSHL